MLCLVKIDDVEGQWIQGIHSPRLLIVYGLWSLQNLKKGFFSFKIRSLVKLLTFGTLKFRLHDGTYKSLDKVRYLITQ